MRRSARLLSFIAALSASTDGRAGAFLQKPGEGAVIVTTSFADAHKAYDSRGRLIAAPSYDKLETQVYLEYGLLEELTLIAESSYMRFRGSNEEQRARQIELLTAQARAGAPLYLPPGFGAGARFEGLGAGWLGGRLRLLQWGETTLSAQGSLRAAGAAARKFLDMRERVQQDGRLQLGWPIAPFGVSGFADLSVGYRSAGQGGDEIRADVTCGLRPWNDILLLAQSFISFSPWSRGENFTASQKFQVSAVYDVTRQVAVQIGARAALRGVNESAERGLLAALWYKF